MTWHYRGVITDGKDHLNDTTSGNTEENDMAVMADNKTVMVVMRTDVRVLCLSLSRVRCLADPTRSGRATARAAWPSCLTPTSTPAAST